MSLHLTPFEFSEPKVTIVDVPFHEENIIMHNGIVSSSPRVPKSDRIFHAQLSTRLPTTTLQ
jgi:hypothetical protein